jgi:hypothetical protein
MKKNKDQVPQGFKLSKAQLWKDNRQLSDRIIKLTKENQRLQSQVEFLIKHTDNLAFSYESAMQRMAEEKIDLEWVYLKETLDEIVYRSGSTKGWANALVQRLNDWIKNSESPKRLKLTLTYLGDLDKNWPVLSIFKKKVQTKLALLERGRDVAFETKRPVQWRDTLGRFMKEAKEKS